MSRSCWLLKTEPQEYAWEDLVKEKETIWDGVRAPAARRHISRMSPGDIVFIYHTGKERAIRGIGEITCSGKGEQVFKVAARRALPRPVTLKQIKESGLFPDWELLRLPRLSVVPVNAAQREKILEWGQ
jgi:predicted RNA-binding protein with PUA-like domain